VDELKDEPWCENWREIIADHSVIPFKKNPMYNRGGSKAGSVRGSTVSES
jgi:hypothetical protein